MRKRDTKKKQPKLMCEAAVMQCVAVCCNTLQCIASAEVAVRGCYAANTLAKVLFFCGHVFYVCVREREREIQGLTKTEAADAAVNTIVRIFFEAVLNTLAKVRCYMCVCVCVCA